MPVQINFFAFVNRYSTALHKEGITVSVDTTENDYWLNNEDLVKTSADLLCDMDTYTQDDSYFEMSLNNALSVVGAQRLGVGLDPTFGYSDNQVQYRFNLMIKSNVSSICIWEDHIGNVTNSMWSHLKTFLGN